MRPVKLTMSAFGPFAATQEVDFREATDAGLFGIYGPTGAGKSSIFNAMTFALFGEGAKKEQPIVTMRSAHASSEQLTEVSLVFELGPRRYLVRRQPDQLRPKTRGEGDTVHAHAAWLFDVTDIEVDAITAESTGRVVAERKVSDVRKEIEALLGYGPDQFRQIVLLPQGRFERFLHADSKDRLDILRELFDVSLYRSLTQTMKEAAAAARRDVEDGRRAHVLALSRHGFASNEEFQAGIDAAAGRSAEAAQAAQSADALRAATDEAYVVAEAMSKRFAEAEAAAQVLAALQGREPAIAEQRHRHDKADRARRAADLETAAAEAKRELEEAQKACDRAIRESDIAAADLARCEAAFETERARAGELQALQRSADALSRHEEALAAASGLKSAHEEAERRMAESDRAAAEALSDQKQLAQTAQRFAERLDRARKAAFERLRLGADLESHRAIFARARDYDACAVRLAEGDRRSADAAALLEEARSDVAVTERRTQDAERVFVEAQAHRLALHLADGDPCPVCGGRDHPDPARGGADPAVAEADWRRAQADLASASKREQDARAQHGAAQGALLQLAAQLDALVRPERPAQEIHDTVTRLEAEISALGEPADLEGLEREGRDVCARHDAAGARHSALQGALQQHRTEEAVARQTYENRIADIPEAYRAGPALAEAQQSAQQGIAAMELAMTQSEEARRRAADEKTKAEAGREAMAGRVSELAAKADRARAAFTSRLEELGLSLQDYAECRPDIGEIERLAAAIKSFEAHLAEALGRAAEAREAVAGLARPELDGLRAERDAAREAARRALGAAAESRAAHDALVTLQSQLAEDAARLERLAAETAPLRGLAEAFDGQNIMRTALETYAIGSMFDHVLESANLRLDPMTAGRYHFERDTESIGGRSKRGLDVRIFDVQTGRTREISTLSGGESFIAALSLALGLSDVVEMNHGGIRLDTIFIDEGFGSLDTENGSGTLDLVLQVLQDIVGQSRAVGLISHVPLVQQAVPNGFSVIKELGGNRIEKRIA